MENGTPRKFEARNAEDINPYGGSIYITIPFPVLYIIAVTKFF